MAKKATSAPQKKPAAPAVTTTPAPGAVQEMAPNSQAAPTPPAGTSPEVDGGFPPETNLAVIPPNPHETGASAGNIVADEAPLQSDLQQQPQADPEVAPPDLSAVQPPRPYDEDEIDAEELQSADAGTPPGRQPDPEIIAEAQKYKVASGAPSQAHKGPPRYVLPQPPKIR